VGQHHGQLFDLFDHIITEDQVAKVGQHHGKLFDLFDQRFDCMLQAAAINMLTWRAAVYAWSQGMCVKAAAL
jgi:hypothetical protein